MKNICKFLGIIAAVAVIGFVTSCGEPDAEDRIEITIHGLPSAANGYWARVELYAKSKGVTAGNVDQTPNDANSRVRRAIRGGETTVEMEHSGKNFADAGDYVIQLLIYDNEPGKTPEVLYYNGLTASEALSKGNNRIAASKFSPDLPSVTFPPLATPVPPQEQLPPSAPPATNYGTYSGESFRTNITETVILQPTSFFITDNSNAVGKSPDSLTFRIDSWAEISAGDLPSEANTGGYTGGYKFKGKITAATSGYVPSLQTAPNFSLTNDVKADGSGPDCWMSIYFKGATGDITFIRTPFSKTENTGGVVSNNTTNNGGNGKVRVYSR